MSDQPAVSSALQPPPGEGWTRQRFLFVIGCVFVLHLALIFLLGTKAPIVPRTVGNVPHLELADGASEFIALGDPTLFARPNAHDIVTAFWRRVPPMGQPNFDWPAPAGYLQAANANFGSVFLDFMQRSQPAEFPLNLKPEPHAMFPVVAWNDTTPRTNTMRISGELARRPVLNPNALVLPVLPRNDVIAPTTVQLLVDAAGNVASAVVVQPNADPTVVEPSAYHDHQAGQLALALARNLRFAPAPKLTFGDLTFTWHTVATNAVPPSPANAQP